MTNNKDNTLYISLDVEAVGTNPISGSMSSFALVAIDRDETIHGTFERNLKDREGTVRDPGTMDFWKKNIHSYMEMQKNQVEPADAMRDAKEWLKSFNRPVVVVAYPAVYDYMWFYSYWMFYNKDFDPIGFSCLDMKTLAMEKLGIIFRQSAKKVFPKDWFSDKYKHDHTSIQDALEQSILFCRMINSKKVENAQS